MKRSAWTLAVSVVTALGGVATAQPNGDQPPVPVDTPPPNPNPPPVVTNPNPPPSSNPAPADDASLRPAEIAIGIGVGYTFPTPLDMMNTFSARLRLISGITLEPRVVVENLNDAADHSTQRFKAALGVRVPLVKHGKFDLELIGEAEFDSVKTPNAATPDMDSDRVTSLGLGWGVGIGWWLSPHFEISASATNPLVQFVRNSTTTSDVTSSTTDIGLIFDPRVSLMIHIYH